MAWCIRALGCCSKYQEGTALISVGLEAEMSIRFSCEVVDRSDVGEQKTEELVGV